MLIADMAQSVERRLGKAEVTGSIPVISLTYGALCICTAFFLTLIIGNFGGFVLFLFYIFIIFGKV